ncbi:MAG: 5-formyltetrahydrofolate cyclo-ligase [Alphaproteobacteria bacterium]
MSLTAQKARARLQAKQKRQAVFDPAAGAELIRRFPAAQFRGATIAGFWPLRGEIDIRPLLFALSDMGHPLALPCTPRVGRPLIMRSWKPDDALKIGSFDTREPYPEQPEVRPDIMLIPLLAFTAHGERLGYGGGFYDRTLADLRKEGNVYTCGVAFAGQEASFLPVDQHDQKLDAILTEKEFREF